MFKLILDVFQLVSMCSALHVYTVTLMWPWVLSPATNDVMRAPIASRLTKSLAVTLVPAWFCVISASILLLCLASGLTGRIGIVGVRLVKAVSSWWATPGVTSVLLPVVVRTVRMSSLGLVLPSRKLWVFVCSVLRMHLLRLKAATMMIVTGLAMLGLVRCCAILMLLSLGTWTLMSRILGCSWAVRLSVRSLLVVRFIILRLGRVLRTTISLAWIKLRLLVMIIWTSTLVFLLVVWF